VRLLDEHLEDFIEGAHTDDPSWHVPAFVQRELRAVAGCGDFLRGFLRFACNRCKEPRIVPFS